MTSLDALNATQSGGGNSVTSTSGGSFGENRFLELLVTELRSQTPLEPVDNGAFMEQLASYSSMEQQQELNQNLLTLLDFQGVLARSQGLSDASSLLGKEIRYEGAGGKSEKGIVDSVFISDEGEVMVRIGDQNVPMRKIVGVGSNLHHQFPSRSNDQRTGLTQKTLALRWMSQ